MARAPQTSRSPAVLVGRGHVLMQTPPGDRADRPVSPFAGMADFSARIPLRVLSPDEIERMLAEHRLYLETEYHQGHRANFASADLAGRDFSGLNLRGVKMEDPIVFRGDVLVGVVRE